MTVGDGGGAGGWEEHVEEEAGLLGLGATAHEESEYFEGEEVEHLLLHLVTLQMFLRPPALNVTILTICAWDLLAAVDMLDLEAVFEGEQSQVWACS